MPSPRASADQVTESAKDVAIVWLLRKAYPHAAWHWARMNIEDTPLAPQVKQVLLDAIDITEA